MWIHRRRRYRPRSRRSISPMTSRTDDFAAVNAYYHCDRFFRTVRDIGFNIPSYFDGTSFPVPVDHHALGNVINAQCRGNTLSNGIGFGGVLACRSRQARRSASRPTGVSCCTNSAATAFSGTMSNSPNFGFAHSAGDSIAVILNDPEHACPRPLRELPVGQYRPASRPAGGGRLGLGRRQRSERLFQRTDPGDVALPALPVDRRRLGLAGAAAVRGRLRPSI